NLVGVKMKDHTHPRPANQVEMHEVIMVRNEIIELALFEPARIGELEVENIARLQRSIHLQRLIDVAGVARSLGSPPLVSEIDGDDENHERNCHHHIGTL